MPDYSNEVLAPRNVDAYSFSLCQVVGRTRPDTLYHYDIANNVLKPCFTLDNVMQEDKYIVTSLHETPEYYWSRVTIGPAKMPSDGSPVRMTVFNVRVSKKDGSVKRIDRFTNDFLGLSYPFLTMRNGYVCISYDPLELMDALDKVLTQTDLEPDVRKRATDLRNSLHENDNDILIMRYAEVLLNYAEAKAELGELTDADWAATIGALRSRAGITGGTPQTGTLTTRPSSAEPYIASYYPTISDPSLLEIRRERGIELCLEGLRLNDLKRWNCCDLWVNDPWEGIFIPSLNQPLDVNGDGNYDAYFYDTDKIADEKYAAIGVYVGTNKSNVLNVKPVQGGYLMEYNYAGRSWPARQYLYPIPEVVIQFNTNLSQNPGW